MRKFLCRIFRMRKGFHCIAERKKCGMNPIGNHLVLIDLADHRILIGIRSQFRDPDLAPFLFFWGACVLDLDEPLEKKLLWSGKAKTFSEVGDLLQSETALALKNHRYQGMGREAHF